MKLTPLTTLTDPRLSPWPVAENESRIVNVHRRVSARLLHKTRLEPRLAKTKCIHDQELVYDFKQGMSMRQNTKTTATKRGGTSTVMEDTGSRWGSMGL